MDTTELRLPQDGAEPESDQLVDISPDSLPPLDSREFVMKGLATSVLLRSGVTHAHDVPMRSYMEAAKTATAWYPDQPVRPEEIRDTIL